MSERRAPGRNVGFAAALLAGAVGVVTGNASVFVAAAVALCYAAYDAAASEPEPRLTVSRRLETETPLPGERVEVTVTVRNEGLEYLPDVRVVDGVPERLQVTDGSPRLGTSLDVDEAASFSYTVEAVRGDHEFGSTTVVCRNLTGSAEYRERVTVETAVECSVAVTDISLPPQTLQHSGRVPTDAGGAGTAFYAIRDHQKTDPMNRIDWNRFARTNELATVEFRETRAASVVAVVDTRHQVAADPGGPTAVQYGTYAAERLATRLLADNNRVGAATFDRGHYCRPEADRGQARRIRSFLADSVQGIGEIETDDGGFLADVEATYFAAVDEVDDQYGVADGGDVVGTLDRKLPDQAQVVFCSPLLDDRAADAVERLSARGHAVTVISPDLTGRDSPGATVAAITRAERLDRLRGAIRVVDWTPTEPLSTALLRAQDRWST